jgi:hypothetical protein
MISTRIFPGGIIFSVACFALPIFAAAQAPAGPITAQPPQPASPNAKPQAPVAEIKPRTTIFGAWKLNRDESDDARKKMQDARRSNQGGGGVRVGGPFPGSGGPYGRRRGGENDEDRQGMQEMLSPSRSLNIAEAKKDVEVDVFDDEQRKFAFFTDGRKVQKSKDANNREISAHWEENRLVTDEKSPRGGKMSRTYELSDDGLQLWETLRVPVGRSNTPVTVRYVYDQLNPAQTTR